MILAPSILVIVVLLYGIASPILPRLVETFRVTQTVTIRETVTHAMPIPTAYTGKILTIRLGEPFTVTMDKQPVELKFTRLRFETRIGQYNTTSGYRFAVIDLEYRNLGTVEARADWDQYRVWDSVLRVSTEHLCKPKPGASNFYALSLKPKAAVAGYFCFEIPADAVPMEIHIFAFEWSDLPWMIVKLS